jgi:hypothetical protein
MEAVDSIVEFARECGMDFDRDEAEALIENRRRLAETPDDPEVQRVARHFEALFFQPADPQSFAVFFEGPRCPPDCPECLERGRRASLKYAKKAMAMWADLPSLRIVERCLALGVFRPTFIEDFQQQGTEGWRGFAKRTGLGAEQVERLSDEELKAFA